MLDLRLWLLHCWGGVEVCMFHHKMAADCHRWRRLPRIRGQRAQESIREFLFEYRQCSVDFILISAIIIIPISKMSVVSYAILQDCIWTTRETKIQSDTGNIILGNRWHLRRDQWQRETWWTREPPLPGTFCWCDSVLTCSPLETSPACADPLSPHRSMWLWVHSTKLALLVAAIREKFHTALQS